MTREEGRQPFSAAAIDRRHASSIGRHARLELRFESRHGRTLLAHAYAEPPFRVGRAFQEGAGLHIVLASSAPGVFGGDVLHQAIHLGPGARVRLSSQSAIQLHPSPDGQPACLRSSYRVGDGAHLFCCWHPLIPFKAARLDQKIDVTLSPEARFHWSDALMNGREARGERWMFESLAHELRVSREGLLEYLERYRIVPNQRRVQQRWVAGDACYFGTLLASGWEIDPEAIRKLHLELGKIAGGLSAPDALDRRLLIVRMMSASGVAFRRARRLSARALTDVQS
jgi:urease accessory protein UreH